MSMKNIKICNVSRPDVYSASHRLFLSHATGSSSVLHLSCATALSVSLLAFYVFLIFFNVPPPIPFAAAALVLLWE